MLLLKTIEHKTIWGGHLYSCYCRKGLSNQILNGKYKGKTLNEVFPLFQSDFGMQCEAYFPLTIALTKAESSLSIQVHPDDSLAVSMEDVDRGKRESWFFLRAPESGQIVNGCLEREKSRCGELIRQRNFEQIYDYLKVKEKDYVFVEPGTLHAITKGSIVYEIEDGADCTYRFYDYERVDANGRCRELHLKKAFQALHLDKKSTVKRYRDADEIIEETYATKYICGVKCYENTSDSIECFTLLEGYLVVAETIVMRGQTVLLWPGETLMCGDFVQAIVARPILRRKN